MLIFIGIRSWKLGCGSVSPFLYKNQGTLGWWAFLLKFIYLLNKLGIVCIKK
jgi:hypothetical protein